MFCEKCGQLIPAGNYKLSVHMWIMNSAGDVYIQRRAISRKLFPDKWENPGGGVVSGQNSLDTLKKEFEEELGISLKDKYKLIKTIKREKDFVDIYIVHQDFEISQLNLQVEEVAEAKWVTLDVLQEMIRMGEFCPTIQDSFVPFIEYLKDKM
jgi:isopentenyldiphosphate isomerase